MIINYKHCEGTQEVVPISLDTISSKSVVYLRKNINRITSTDGSHWEYDEAQLTLPEFEEYKKEAAAQLASKINDDNIALMEAIVENYEQFMEVQENILILMSAIADIYDKIG